VRFSGQSIGAALRIAPDPARSLNCSISVDFGVFGSLAALYRRFLPFTGPYECGNVELLKGPDRAVCRHGLPATLKPKTLRTFIVLAVLTSLLAAPVFGQTLTTLHRFGISSDGHYPMGGLISDNMGNLYGTTNYGGTYGKDQDCPGRDSRIGREKNASLRQ